MLKLCIFTCIISLSYSQLAYPEENPLGDTDIDSREPLYIPGLCPINQWYWPGDQKSDWICDCAIRFVYYPPTDTCHELYRQGPCKNNEYLILKKGNIIPECVNNPCRNDTIVPFNYKCFPLYKTDGCIVSGKDIRTLNVNHNSLELECSLENVKKLNDVIHISSQTCLPGSKRNSAGKCRIIV